MDDKAEGPERTTQSLRLLRTKLNIPRAHPDLVERTWLIERMSEGLKRKLTLVAAPAGSGKTTLLCTWVRQLAVPVAWVSLDERDNDPIRFWAYVVAALETIAPGIGETALALLQSPQPAPFEAVLTELLNDIEQTPSDFVLVLDDYHVIYSQQIHTALAFLLEHLPPQMHVVIAGRTEPPLPLPQLRVRRDMLALRPADLRFSTAEITAFLNQVMQLDLTVDDITILENITEGWAAGLQLAALSMQGADTVPEFIRSFTGSHRYVFDYLAQEVLDRQPESVRRFLLRTSILERMCGELCAALFEEQDQDRPSPIFPAGFPDSQSILETLERLNLFIVPLDDERKWYRYHHLFADFLQARLAQGAQPTEISDLHLRASRWYEKENLIAEAIAHAMQAGDFDRAGALVIQIGEFMFQSSELNTVIGWLDGFPPELMRANPQLNMLLAWALLASSRFNEVEPRLQEIEAAFGVTSDPNQPDLGLPAHVRGALGEVASIRANLAFHRMDLPSVLALSRRGLAYLTDDVQSGLIQPIASLQAVNAFNLALAYEFGGEDQAARESFQETVNLSQKDRNTHLFLFASSHLGQLQIGQGQLHQAAQTFREALSSTSKSHTSPSPISGLVHVGLGNILYEWDELTDAAYHFTEGIELGRIWANWETLLPGYLGSSRVLAAHGDLAGALDSLDELDGFAERMHPQWGLPLLEAQRARLWMLAGHHQLAGQWAQSASLDFAGEIPFAREAEALLLSRVLAGLGKPDEALALVERLLSLAEAGKRRGRIIEVLALLAALLQMKGMTETALDALRRAIDLAEPEGYVRIFVDEGAPMAQLLQLVVQHGLTREYVSRLLVAYSSEGKEESDKAVSSAAQRARPPSSWPATVEHLSERELEVLRLIADGLTNQQIANQLVVSLNTIKTHVKNILTHLDVQNRTQAVTRARELGLL